MRSRGGFPPPERKRNALPRSLAEREEISRGLGAGHTLTRIAAVLGRSVSTVCREVGRNGGARAYRANVAASHAWDRAARPQACKLSVSGQLRCAVAAKLCLQWSPAQISGWLRTTFPDDERMQVSHATIYRSLFVQARGVLKQELLAHLCTRRVMRHARHATINGQHRGQIADAVTISERSPQVEDRSVPGHWEGDVLEGSRGTAIATLVERQSRFTMLVKVRGKDTTGVTTALARQVRKLPAELRRSLTWDRGHEMAHHKAFTVATDVAVYFCDPSSPWQRGTNENTNSPATPVLPQAHRPVRACPGSPEQDRPAPEPAPAQDLGFQNAGGYTGGCIAMMSTQSRNVRLCPK